MLIDYIVNVIIISDYFQDYTRYLIIYHVISCQRYGLVCEAKYNYKADRPTLLNSLLEHPLGVNK